MTIHAIKTARNERDFVLQLMEERRMEAHADAVLTQFGDYLRSRYRDALLIGREIHMRGLQGDEYFEVETTAFIPEAGERLVKLMVGSASRSENVGWFSAHEPDEEEFEGIAHSIAKYEPDTNQLEFDFMN